MAHGIFNLCWGIRDLAPQPGIKPRPHALGAWNFSHRTTREVTLPFVFCEFFFLHTSRFLSRVLLVALVVKNPPANTGDVRDVGLIPESERYSGGGHGNPPQYSCLENPHGQRSLEG